MTATGPYRAASPTPPTSSVRAASTPARVRLTGDFSGQGDSGGPLMTYQRLDQGGLKMTAAGIVSFAVGCGNARYPGIYTKVDAYLDWIAETITNNS